MRILALCVALAAGPVVAETVCVDLRLPNALQMGDAKEWQRLAHVSLIFEDGVLQSGRVGPFSGGLIGGWSTVGWTGRFDGGDVRFEGDTLTGTIRADLQVTAGRIRGQLVATVLDGGVTAGQYTFDLDGPMVGHSFMGIFTTHLGDQSKTGYFVGTLQP